MSFTDILTIPFLISLGITLLLLALISMFFLQRLNEQNHKISSMMGLVTTMAEELNFIRGRLQMGQQQQQQQVQLPRQSVAKIPVSDDEDEDEEESESDEDDDSDSESEDEEDTDSEDEDDEDTPPQEKNVKIINMSENFDINYENLNTNEAENQDDSQDVTINELGDLELGEDELDSEDDDKEEDEKEIVTLSNNDLLKSINLTEEVLNKKEFEIQDYKKMSLSKLKETVVEKGLTQDASKMNKNKLFTLLGVK